MAMCCGSHERQIKSVPRHTYSLNRRGRKSQCLLRTLVDTVAQLWAGGDQMCARCPRMWTPVGAPQPASDDAPVKKRKVHPWLGGFEGLCGPWRSGWLVVVACLVFDGENGNLFGISCTCEGYLPNVRDIRAGGVYKECSIERWYCSKQASLSLQVQTPTHPTQ